MDVLLVKLRFKLRTDPCFEVDVLVLQENYFVVCFLVYVGVDSVSKRNWEFVHKVNGVLSFFSLMLYDTFDLIVELRRQLVLLEYLVENYFFFMVNCFLGFLAGDDVGKCTRCKREKENTTNHQENTDHALSCVCA